MRYAPWDLAAAIAEFDMDDRCAFALVRAFERASEDAGPARHVAFCQLAYTAFRAGYVTMAADGALPEERRRLTPRHGRAGLSRSTPVILQL